MINQVWSGPQIDAQFKKSSDYEIVKYKNSLIDHHRSKNQVPFKGLTLGYRTKHLEEKAYPLVVCNN